MAETTIQRLRRDRVLAVLARGGTSSFLVTLAGYSGTLCLQLVLARALGADQYGVFAYVVTWLVGIELLVLLGLDTAIVRYVPEYIATRDWPGVRGVLRRSVEIVLPMGAVVGLGLVGVTWLFQDRIGEDLTRTFWWAAPLLPVLALLALSQGALRSLLWIGRSQAPTAVVRPLVLGGSVAVLVWGLGRSVGSADAMRLNLVAHAVALTCAVAWLRRALPAERLTAKPRFATREWLRVSLPLLLVREMRMLMDTVDILMVGTLLGTTEAGIYAVATRIARLTTFGQRAGNMVTAPVISDLHTRRAFGDLQRAVTVASWASFITSLVLAGVLVLGLDLALQAFGAEFLAGRTVTWILIGGLIVNAWTGPVGNLLNMTGNQDVNARIIAVGAVLEIALVFPATWEWGMVGAAAVTSGLMAGKNLATWWAVRGRLGINSSIFPVPVRPRY